MSSWFCIRLDLNFYAFAWRGIYVTAERAVMLVKKVNYFWKFGFLKSSCITKIIILVFWVPREINSRFCRKTQWQMFLLISSCHVGDHLDVHQHGVSIQISINLGKNMYPPIFLKRNVCDLNLGEGFAYVSSFFSHILDLIYWTVLIFILIYFEWRDTENQQNIGRTFQSCGEAIYRKSSLTSSWDGEM